MPIKHIAFILRQAFTLGMIAGVVALMAATTTADDVAVFARKVAGRVLDNIEWLALLPANHSERFFLPYLALTLVIALVIVGREAGKPLAWRALLGRIFPREIYWHRSARVDY